MRSIRITRGFATLAMAALLLAACSSDPSAGRSDDQKAVEAAVRASLTAENDKDVNAFVALWTDKGLAAYDVGTREDLIGGRAENFGEDKIEIVEFPSVDVSGTTATATVDALRGENNIAKPIFRVKFDLTKQGDAWLLDGFEFLGGPPPAAGTAVVDVKAQEYAFLLDKTEVGGKFAFKFANIGQEQHELTLYKGPNGVDLGTAKAALENVDGGELEDIPAGYEVDHITFAEAGQTQDVTFAEPLAPGTYVLTCYIPQGGFGDQGPVNPDGKAHIKLGMISILTVS